MIFIDDSDIVKSMLILDTNKVYTNIQVYNSTTAVQKKQL
jgi:hypothetical protein